jgi:hypothetical protein
MKLIDIINEEKFTVKNEENVSQEELNKYVKKLKLIYKTLKTGVIKIEEDDTIKKYSYVLNDIYAIIANYTNGTRMIITPDGLIKDALAKHKFKLYEVQSNGEKVFIDKEVIANWFLYTKVWNKIAYKFQGLNVALR